MVKPRLIFSLEINDLVTVSYKFLQEVPSKLEIQCEKGMYFSFDFAGILSILILSFKNMEWIWGGGGGGVGGCWGFA